MQIKFNIKAAKDGEGSLRINYNKAGGKNGSAGFAALNFNVKTAWESKCFYLHVPADAAAMQFVFSFNGRANDHTLNNLYFGMAPDRVTVPVAQQLIPFKAALNRPPWNPKAPLAAKQKCMNSTNATA